MSLLDKFVTPVRQNLTASRLRYITIAILSSTIALGFWSYQNSAQAGDRPEALGSHFQFDRPYQLFIPNGFDDNDNIVIMAAGDYDMSCEEMKNFEAEVNESNKEIRILNKKQRYAPESECSKNYERYFKEYNIGKLEPGTYEVIGVGGNDDDIIDNLVVRESTSKKADVSPYPNILDMRLGLSPDGTANLYVDLELSQSCQHISDFQIKRRGDNFWQIYSKVKNLKLNCQNGSFVVTKRVSLGEIKKQTHVFYLKSTNNQSVFHIEALI